MFTLLRHSLVLFIFIRVVLFISAEMLWSSCYCLNDYLHLSDKTSLYIQSDGHPTFVLTMHYCSYINIKTPTAWQRRAAAVTLTSEEQMLYSKNINFTSLTNAVLIKCNNLKAVTFKIAFTFCVCLIYSDIGKYSKLFLIIVKVKVYSDLCAPSFMPDILSLTVRCTS